MNKKVLITGFLGQDGSNMAEFLLKNTSYEVYGMIRRSANPNFVNVESLLNDPRLHLVYGDLTDGVSLDKIVQTIQPDYFINLAANSFVGCSWDMPLQVFETNALGVVRCLEAIRKYRPTCRFYSAGSSEEFGDVQYSPQDIEHPMRPRSPYGASKCAARCITKVYRESYGLYAVHGILFNHEGTRRGEEFVTRKITKGIARILRQINFGEKVEPIELGNLDAKRDWSDSEDFVEGIWRMLNQEVFNPIISSFAEWSMLNHIPKSFPNADLLYTKFLSTKIKEYVLASGETHTVREFLEKAFEEAGIKIADTNPDRLPPLTDEKNGLQVNYATPEGIPVVVVNPKFYRPADVELLVGNSGPIREELGWKPKVSFSNLIAKMIENDVILF